jgi:RimJ/RimL family protein N-acetyltransferase
VEIVLHEAAETFAAAAGPVLCADPLRHTVALTVLDGIRRAGHEAAALLTLHEAGKVVGAALRTPGRPVLVSAVPARHAAAAEEALATADPELTAATGPIAELEAFAAARVARTGDRTETRMRTRLFALDTLTPPTGIPGAARRGDESDTDLLAAWRLAFVDEDHGGWQDPLSPRETVLSGLRLGCAEILWEVGGEPVSQATARPVVAGMSRIGPVYTPPEHRNHGYAAAATAAASQWALDAGAERVLLFTDLANPVTNRLYPRLGYRPVHDAAEVHFVA